MYGLRREMQGFLRARQHQIAEKKDDMLMRAFAKVGIIALN